MTERAEYEKNLIKQCFKNKEIFLTCIEKVPNEKLFKDSMSRLFWQIFTMIYRDGSETHISVVNDILKATSNQELIPIFDQYISEIYTDEDQWEYHLSYLSEQYKKEILLDVSETIRKGIGSKSSEEILTEANAMIIDLNSSDITSKSFKHSYRETAKSIRNIAKGNQTYLLRTGHKNFDDIVSLGPKQIIMMAAQKKQGKTRFLVHLMDRLITHNLNDIDIQWYSFEMQSDEMCRLFISKKLALTDKQMLSINYTLTEDQLDRIDAASTMFEKYPIDFVDETADIFKICSKFERFAGSRKGKIPVLVIDNLGLIKPHSKNDNQNDDDIARMLKDLRDKTNALIIVLHHLSKESEGKFNVTELYRPKVTHIRGSSRIVDFANKVLLQHRPEMYKDVVKHFEKEGKGYLIHGLMEVDCALNRNGDTGTINFRHHLEYCNFEDFTPSKP